jgi:ABC-type transport system involved in cytochrome c biogenesis permease subunit
MTKWLPWIVVGVFAAWIASSLRMPPDKTWAVRDFAKLPLVSNGRFQPMDSLARNSLLQLREKQAVYLKNEKRYLSATAWIMEVFMDPTQADQRRVFRIDHPELISLLKLPEKNPETGEDGKHYAWSQLEPGLAEMDKQTKRISQIELAHRNSFERAVMDLQEKLFLYMRLRNTLQPQESTNFQAELKEYLSLAESGLAAFRARQAGQPHDEALLQKFTQFLNRYDRMMRLDTPLLVPPHHPENSRDEWVRMGEALLEAMHGQPLHFAVSSYAAMTTAYRQGQVEAFNQALQEYRQKLSPSFGSELAKASREYFFNYLQVFYKCSVLYVFAFLLACFSWFNRSEAMRRSAFYLLVLAFAFHTTGLLFRMILEARPPVTNLYSSAIFIGWGAVFLGLVLERIFKDGIGSAAASAVGFITLVIAHNLALGGDTMQMMRAVLDTNFWLATHVVVITLGYSATFFAGFLAILYIVRGVLTPTLSEQTAQSLTRMVYSIICFATLFSFVGTVLGGIWADQSWGRFWGWDPKENGALIIVLWNALILHARWGGMIKARGLMNMAIGGNIVTSWSWFGVNMLGIGLHSYGFMDSAFRWLVLFIASQLVLICLGLLPQKRWRSLRTADIPLDIPETGPAPQPTGK